MTPIAPSLQQPVDAFLRYLKVERQLSPLTQLSYSRQLAALMRLDRIGIVHRMLRQHEYQIAGVQLLQRLRQLRQIAAGGEVDQRCMIGNPAECAQPAH